MKRNIILIIGIFILLSTLQFANAQNTIVGRWKTIDDETELPKSIVSIYQEGDKFYGKIDSLYRQPGEDLDPVCSKCPDDDPRKDKRIIGMVIIKDMVQDDNEWKDGTILDPKKGKIYDCKLWLEDGNLRVRGYIFFLFRTQTWYPVK